MSNRIRGGDIKGLQQDPRIKPMEKEIADLKRQLNAAVFVARERERELLEVKGPCSNLACALHYAHSGPCRPKETGRV